MGKRIVKDDDIVLFARDQIDSDIGGIATIIGPNAAREGGSGIKTTVHDILAGETSIAQHGDTVDAIGVNRERMGMIENE